MSVSVRSRQRRVRVSASRLGAVARSALSSLGRRDRDLHVTVVGDREIRRLHERYLGRRRATDVLAFDLGLGAGTGASPGPRPVEVSRRAASLARRESRSLDGPSRLLGEVIISADTAARQAARLGVAVALEIDLLLLHGLLHLVGYDDHDPGQARLMHEREREILARVRRRPPPARLWTGLIEQGPGARAVATPAPRRRRAPRSRRRPIRVAVNPDRRP